MDGRCRGAHRPRRQRESWQPRPRQPAGHCGDARHVWMDGAEALIAGGANVNRGNRGGETPLIMAVQRGNLAMVRMLLANGANPNQTDNVSGNSAIDYARQDRRTTAILRELETRR